MHVTGKLKDIQYSKNQKLIVMFEVNEKQKALDELDAIKDDELIIDAQVKKNKRSLSANAYFWVLADKIAKKVKSNKWDIYLILLSKYGVFVDVLVMPDAVDSLKEHFRTIEVIEQEDMCNVRCYYGQSTYTTSEMYYLLQGTIEDARELGIEVATPSEIEEMMAHFERDKR